MNDFLRRISALPSAIGWTGGIGLALLLSTCVLGLSFLLPAREESERMRKELRLLSNRRASASASSRPVAGMRQQLDEFLGSLPPQDQINAQLSQLNELAASHRVVLKNGVYRTTTSKDGRIGRLQISVRTQARYADIRGFLHALSADMPAMSVGRISLTRQKRVDAALEASFEVTLFFQRADL